MQKSQRDVLLGLALLIVAGAGGAYLMLRPATAQPPAATTSPGEVKVEKFDGQRAIQHIKDICSLGPRVSDTIAHGKMIDMIEKHFTEQGLTVNRQNFKAKQRSKLAEVTMTNLIAKWKPEAKVRLLICTHYDTRPLADQEEDKRKWTSPFVAANDGAAGPALMMELARHLKALDAPLGIDFVCFDGEEFIFDNRQSDEGGDIYFIGSRYFADEYAKRITAGGDTWAYKEAVLLDMPAGIDARFLMEGESVNKARPLVERIWKIAEENGVKNFINQRGVQALDDHLELLRVGIPAIDIIPVLPSTFEGKGLVTYPHWHKLSDTPDNCSAETLENVAKVLMIWLKTTK
jgi:glutaminyl-peptide cyclotransferase